jgi:hypothetical protein
VTFNYNYASNGIASAPNSTGGTTRGVKFEANMISGTAAAINISPVGQSFSGDYRLRFDMWINANGPFPLGGNGSTEHLTAGIGTAGNKIQWTNTATADGYWFAVDGEGQAADAPTGAFLSDYEAFSGTTRHAAESGVFASGTASNARGNGNSYYAGTFPGGQTAPALQQSSYAQQTGGLAVGTAGMAWRDVIISKTGNTVEWFINGLKIATISGASFTANNIFVGYWDGFNSISDNAALSFGLVDNVRVERYVTNAPPFLTSQPANQTVVQGNDVTFGAVAGGTTPLSYQWRQNGTAIAGATGSSYTRSNAQAAHAGNYTLVATNVAGSVTSAVAVLTVLVPEPLRFEGASVQPDGGLRLVLSGEPGVYVIEQSSTLTNWSFLVQLTNGSGTLEFTDEPVTNHPARFYRARLAP